MMLAITHLNPVLGVDIHIVQPPGPVPPIPIPHPYLGMVFDPADYIPLIGSTVSIHGLPRAIAGTAGRTAPFHFPIGGVFVKPPGNEDENFMGSSTVSFDGDAATFMMLPALSCHDIGMIAPPRLNPKKVTKMKSMLLPTSIALPIPAGPPVTIGGPPTISLSGLGMKLGMAGLGKALKALAKTKLVRKGLKAFKKARQRIFRNMKPGFLKCKILRAEPVDSVTGEVVVDQQDFTIPGRIPIEWTRHYGSQSERAGCCGHGWETPADARLEFDYDGSITFHDGSGAPSFFDAIPIVGGEPVQEPVDGGELIRRDSHYLVRLKEGLTYYFPIPKDSASGGKEVLVDYVTDRFGSSLRYIRDENGLREIRESSGRYIEVTSRNRRIEMMRLVHPTDKEPRLLVFYRYDENGDLIEVYDPLKVPYSFQYSRHRIVRHKDRNGLSFCYEYDQTEPDGKCIHAWGDGGLYDYRFVYREIEGITEVTDSLGQLSKLKYNNRYLITSEIDPLGGVTSYEYDDVGRTIAEVDPDGARTEYQYDHRGNLNLLVRPDGKKIEAQFNADDKPVRVIDPNGGVWEQQWDHNGLLTEQTSPLGAASHFKYDERGQIVEFVNPLKSKTELSFDKYGSVARLTDAMGGVQSFSYDPLGNVTLKVDPLGQQIRYRYDPKGRLTEIELSSGNTVACAYDAEDNLTRYQDENGALTRLEYFGQGEIKRRIQPNGIVVEYHYDTEERLIAVTNQRGERYELKRDALGRIIEEIDYWGQKRKYRYSKAGNLRESIDPLGQIIQFKTDPLGQIIEKLLPDPDTCEKQIKESFEYDANENLIACENKAIRIERKFDAESRLVEERQGKDCVLSNSYDASGNRLSRVTQINLPDKTYSYEVKFQYDALDQAVGVEIPDHAPLRLVRNALGQVVSETLSASLRRNFEYSPEGYLTSQQVLASSGPLFEQNYSYDRAGNLIEKRDSQYGADRFIYDTMGRIVEHLNPDGEVKRSLYDPAGDRLRTRVVDQTQNAENGKKSEWAREGRFENALYQFDRAGSLVKQVEQNGDLQLSWDANQRLIKSIKNGISTTYLYDPLGRRIRKETHWGEGCSSKGEQTRFYWDGDALLGDSLSILFENGNTSQKSVRQWICYPLTFEPLAMVHLTPIVDPVFGLPLYGVNKTALFFYQNDPNGCPVRMLDTNGKEVWSARYDAWGKVDHLYGRLENRVDNPIRMQGQYADAETGLYYNRYRYLDPISCSFVSQDPLGLGAGENVYAYALNVWGWADPFGLECKVLEVSPKNVNFCQKSINKAFDTPGGKVSIDKIVKQGAEQVRKFPPIRVVMVKGQLVARDGNSRLFVALKTKAQSIKVVLENDINSMKDLTSRLRKNGLPNNGTAKLPTPR